MRLPLFRGRLSAVSLLLVLAGMPGWATGQVDEPVLNYEARIETYLELRRNVTSNLPSFDEVKDIEKIRSVRRSLAASIRRARSGAKQGDILTRAIGKQFRELLKPEVDRAGIAEELTEEIPAVPLKVNAEYPETQPFTSVPPSVLQALPRLPKGEGLEYRFVQRHLLILDTRAHLVIDFLLNALP